MSSLTVVIGSIPLLNFKENLKCLRIEETSEKRKDDYGLLICRDV